MMMRRTTEIIIETDEVLLFKKTSAPVVAWCSQCKAEREMFVPEVAAIIAHLSTREIYRLIEANRIHFTESADHALYVCLHQSSSSPTSPPRLMLSSRNADDSEDGSGGNSSNATTDLA
jgi:hypothetical protein